MDTSLKEFKICIRDEFNELSAKIKEQLRDQAREINHRLKASSNIGISEFFGQLKEERKKPKGDINPDWAEDYSLEITNNKKRWKSRA